MGEDNDFLFGVVSPPRAILLSLMVVSILGVAVGAWIIVSETLFLGLGAFGIGAGAGAFAHVYRSHLINAESVLNDEEYINGVIRVEDDQDLKTVEHPITENAHTGLVYKTERRRRSAYDWKHVEHGYVSPNPSLQVRLENGDCYQLQERNDAVPAGSSAAKTRVLSRSSDRETEIFNSTVANNYDYRVLIEPVHTNAQCYVETPVQEDSPLTLGMTHAEETNEYHKSLSSILIRRGIILFVTSALLVGVFVSNTLI